MKKWAFVLHVGSIGETHISLGFVEAPTKEAAEAKALRVCEELFSTVEGFHSHQVRVKDVESPALELGASKLMHVG